MRSRLTLTLIVQAEHGVDEIKALKKKLQEAQNVAQKYQAKQGQVNKQLKTEQYARLEVR